MEDGEAMVSNLWSAQYMAAGVLCAFAGAALDMHAGGAGASPAQFTHATRFRFGSLQVRQHQKACTCKLTVACSARLTACCYGGHAGCRHLLESSSSAGRRSCREGSKTGWQPQLDV